jgi:hypothetical protein
MKKYLGQYEAYYLTRIETIEFLLNKFYSITDQKFSINYLGSKGYLHGVEIEACGNHEQSLNNRIDFVELKKNKKYQEIKIDFYFDLEKGVEIIINK